MYNKSFPEHYGSHNLFILMSERYIVLLFSHGNHNFFSVFIKYNLVCKTPVLYNSIVMKSIYLINCSLQRGLITISVVIKVTCNYARINVQDPFGKRVVQSFERGFGKSN